MESQAMAPLLMESNVVSTCGVCKKSKLQTGVKKVMNKFICQPTSAEARLTSMMGRSVVAHVCTLHEDGLLRCSRDSVVVGRGWSEVFCFKWVSRVQ